MSTFRFSCYGTSLEPGMYSMPVIAKHPSDRFWAGQSLDNQIVVYQAGDRFAQQRKKRFSGHSIAGYACDIAFSPNGKFIASGDGNGECLRRHFS